MFVHLPPSMTVSVSASALRGIRCENCNAEYLYKMTRRATETHTAPPNARAHVEKSVAKRAKKSLKKGIDPVPCPACGYLQRNMVRTVKSEQIAMLMLIAMPVMFVIAIVAFLSFFWMYAVIFTSLIVLVVAAVLIVLRDHNTRQRMEQRLMNPSPTAILRKDFPGELPSELFEKGTI
jgi:Flp pilus assembly protein TadB